MIQNISKKWSRLSKREATPFCPYVCLNGLSDEHLVQLKTLLHDEGVGINDGHPYLGSPFFVTDILKKANYSTGISIKIIICGVEQNFIKIPLFCVKITL